MNKLISGIAMAIALATLSNGAIAHEGHTGVAGDAKKVDRTVEIVMKEGEGSMSYEPAVLRIKRGETVRFSIKNHGALEHELVIDSFEGNAKHKLQMEKNPDMEHDDPNAVRVKPGSNGTIVWQFTKAGKFEYACLIPGHYEGGMKGVIEVQ